MADKKRADGHLKKVEASGVACAGDIKEVAWAAAWHAANSRKGFSKDAKKDEQQFLAAADRLCDAGVPGAFHIKWLAWNISWHCANERLKC